MKKKFMIKVGTVIFLLLVFLPIFVTAQSDIQKPELLVPLGDLKEFTDIDQRQCIGPDSKEGDECYYIPWIAQYVQAAYRYGVILGAVLAVTIFVISGGLYLTSGLNPALQQKAKGYMTGAVIGLTLLLGAYMVLRLINPDLIALRPIEVQVLKRTEIPDPFCSNVKDSEYFRVERLADEREAVTSNAAEYSSGGDQYMRCGVKYNVAVREQHRKSISIPSGSTCVGGVCDDPKKFCNKFGGYYACIEGVIHGIIKFKGNQITITEDDPVIPYVLKDEFSIMSKGSRLENVISSFTNLKNEYRFSGGDWLETLPVNQPVYLRAIIDRPGKWTFSAEQRYYIDANGNPIGFDSNYSKCCTYTLGTDGKLVKTAGCELYSVATLKRGIREIDLDLEKFFAGKTTPIKSLFAFDMTGCSPSGDITIK